MIYQSLPGIWTNVQSVLRIDINPMTSPKQDEKELLDIAIMQFGSNGSNISSWHPYSKVIVWLAAITIISSIYSIHKFNSNNYSLILTPGLAKIVTSNRPDEAKPTTLGEQDNSANFIVYNTKCRIPNLEVYNKDVKPFVHKVSYERCTKFDPLTYVEKFNNSMYLYIDQHMQKAYAPYGKLTCCFSIIRRTPENNAKTPDDSYSTSTCFEFQNETMLNTTIEFLIVKCYDFRNSKKSLVYSNLHSVVPLKETVHQRIKGASSKFTKEPISVLMIGIDSISRLNFFRTMPITAKYLQENDWYEMKGYNKMGDNTFPNLMAIFTGMEQAQAYNVCQPTQPKKLDACPMIWSKYREAGYATAYAEDEAEISTFNYNKKGFYQQPTDHYIRPLILAAGKTLKRKKIGGLDFCLGAQTSEEIILNYSYQFIDTYKNDPYMGFFWMNGFSHNDVNEPSMVDFQTKKWFEMAETTGVFNKSIVIFLSDHGIRFGKIRETHSGWLEERLPFLFLYLPKWFKEQFPEAATNLQANAKRFTTPYDLHITLQDILLKSGRITQITPSQGCPNCQSFFSEIPFDRGCDDANIALHWCTCLGFVTISNTSKDVQKSAQVFVDGIKSILKENENTRKLCKVPSLRRILDSRKSRLMSGRETYFILIIEVYPSGKFEGTITKTNWENGTSTYALQDGVSRIDMYSSQSKCISSSYYKKYCYCKR